jgi:hypothetical protein
LSVETPYVVAVVKLIVSAAKLASENVQAVIVAAS